MSDTPRTDRVIKNCSGWHHVPVEISKELERELNAANAQIGLLISGSKKQERKIEFFKKEILQGIKELEQQDARIGALEAVVNDPHALWANWLRGTVKLPGGIGDVRKYQDHIKKLEKAGDKLVDPAWQNIAWEGIAIQKLIDAWTKAKEAKP